MNAGAVTVASPVVARKSPQPSPIHYAAAYAAQWHAMRAYERAQDVQLASGSFGRCHAAEAQDRIGHELWWLYRENAVPGGMVPVL